MKYLFVIFVVIDLSVTGASAQNVASDSHALSAIFGERHIADNALTVHWRALKMPAEERFQYLADWVLPGVGHDTIRVALDFTPTHPAPPIGGKERIDIDRLKIAKASGQSRVQIGGQLVAPALDLVEVAKTLGRLKEIRDRVDRFTPTTDQQQRSRLAMLIAVDTTGGDFAAAQGSLDRLDALVQAGTHSSFSERCPETIAIWAALRRPENRDIVQNILFRIIDRQLRRNVYSGVPAWEVHIQAMWGRANASPPKPGQSFGTAPALQQWSGTNRVLASSRGRGNPQSHWQTGPSRVENLAIHCDDYLFFQSPLRGNFEVECDVTPFGWRDTTIYVAGKWVAPVYNLTSYRVGNVRREQPRRPLSRKLIRPRKWFHYRAVVRDGIFSTYFNGRKIHDEPLPAEHEPWLAIRSELRNAGVTRGLRITGHPVIPESVKLSATPDLSGWMPYFGESVGRPNSDWRQHGGLKGGGGITGRRRAELTGSGMESLLYYVRPMLEDGKIEYEFYYRDGESHTHPALDRLAFILDRRGVRIHWITDGKHERTGLDPLNIAVELPNRRGPAELPLKDDAWNRLKISLAGNTVHLSLNGQQVYERRLEATNQRTFGLFHYADRTEARVRNIVWKGDWPRKLPPVKEQELAEDGTDFLDEDLAKLKAVFEHDFAKGGLPADRFTVLQNGWQNFVVAQPDGVHVTRPGRKGYYLNYSIVPRCLVKGDFDITASFKNFGPRPPKETEETTCSLFLSAELNDEAQTHTDIYSRHVRKAGRADDQPVQGMFSQTMDGQIRRNYFGNITFEAESGTLRLARRGKKMYFLIAEHDSSNFRLIGEQTLSDADLHREGVRLHNQVFGPGSSSVVWTSIKIRATEIINLAVQDRTEKIAELQKQLTGDLPTRALEFDGRTQYVTVPSFKYDGSHPITLEVYVTHDRIGGIVLGNTQQSGIGLGIPSKSYNIHAWNGKNYNAATSTGQAPTNVRVHIAGTFDGKMLTVFANGKLLKTSPLLGKFVPSEFPLTIGASPSPRESGLDFPFAGVIAGVRVSKTIRYTKDFKPPVKMETDDDTLAVYRFDEGRGKILRDASGNKHHGEIRGAKWVGGSAIRHRAALGLAEFGRYAVGVLTEALKHQNPDVRLEAVIVLEMIGEDAKSAVPALKQLAKDKDQRVTAAAARATAKIEGKTLLKSLLKLFN